MRMLPSFDAIYENITVSEGTMRTEDLFWNFHSVAVSMMNNGFLSPNQIEDLEQIEADYERYDEKEYCVEDLERLIDDTCNEYGYTLTTHCGDPALWMILNIEELNKLACMF